LVEDLSLKELLVELNDKLKNVMTIAPKGQQKPTQKKQMTVSIPESENEESV
jgi:hypothetical protein